MVKATSNFLNAALKNYEDGKNGDEHSYRLLVTGYLLHSEV